MNSSDVLCVCVPTCVYVCACVFVRVSVSPHVPLLILHAWFWAGCVRITSSTDGWLSGFSLKVREKPGVLMQLEACGGGAGSKKSL